MTYVVFGEEMPVRSAPLQRDWLAVAICIEHAGRPPFCSINFITSHDGFTMNDLVSYKEKHNLANGEEGRDGDNHNISDNYGVRRPDTRKKSINQSSNATNPKLLDDATCSAKAFQCWSAAMKFGGRKKATTMPIAKTTTSVGSIGNLAEKNADMVRFVKSLDSSFGC